MSEDAAKLRKQILELTKKFYLSAHAPAKYGAGGKIPYAGRVFDEKELCSLVDSSLDFWLTAGRYSLIFEAELAKYTGAKSALFVNSGSSANLLALSCLTSPLLGSRRIMAGDEVITTAASFPTTVNPIMQNGAVPVFIDTEPGTYNIDAKAIEDGISEKTKAIMVAHTLGNPFDLDAVMKICKKHNLLLVEDCCDALGATWDGKKVGTFGDAATLSFYPAHHITTGEGGAVLTSNALIKRSAESFRDWGRDCWCAPGADNTCSKRFSWKLGDLPYGYDHKYVYSHIGYNLKATDMQAAVGVEQLKKADSFIAARRKNHAYLLKALCEHSDYFIMPKSLQKANPSPFGFALTVRKDAPFAKSQIVAHLEREGIATRQLFAGNIVRQPAYKGLKYRAVGNLAGADTIMNDTFWFGVYPALSREQLDFMLGSVSRFIKSIKG